MSDSLAELKHALRRFNDARCWAKFHSPKNLSIALMIETAEVAEHFRWLTEEESRNLSAEMCDLVGEELADVLIFLVILADKLDVDLESAAWRKLRKNGQNYPVERARGNAEKHG